MDQMNGTNTVETVNPKPKTRSELLAKVMKSINLADSADEQIYYRNLAYGFGLRLKPGFYIQRRKISQALIDQIQNTVDDSELTEILKEANYRELVY